MGRPTCATCAAFSGDAELNPDGRCRRHAPSVDQWPYVSPTDWCLDHVPDAPKAVTIRHAEAVEREGREIDDAIRAEVNLRLAAKGLPELDRPESAPFTPFTGPVLQCGCASCEAYRTPSAPPPTQDPKPTPQGSPGPAPEPDPQGL